ncbi:STAS domain-containing protein [Falsibacillus albus]|uniref:STAS domain-containing protein n=1 Tax=Falsibacillus albus TaxID=2478915 RepID=A0A3L7JW15_9BACI|nr:STAS domain-containing protein [Falsibacillus albus]RLQ93851.1 STAS domain-containing protein [Falsibacillus albus]
MEEKANALYQFLNEHAPQFTEDWLQHQVKAAGSDYSVDAPAHTLNRIKEQNSQYVRYVAQSLLQTDDEMKKTISEWTSMTAADRVKSQTSLTEVASNSGIFRRVYWQYVQRFVHETSLEITMDDIFEWEKKINYTLDYVLETFTAHFMEILLTRLSSQANLIKELSAPVIALTEKVGLLPLIGDIDTDRAKSLMESTLEQSMTEAISVLVIDFSGVIMVDTMVAHQLFQMIEALRMIGIKTIVTGIRPEIAQTSIQLGVDFSEIETVSTLKDIILKIML